MGQLRTGIENLNKNLKQYSTTIDELNRKWDALDNQVIDLCKKCDAGYDQIFLYLKAKFEKNKSTIEQNLQKKLREIIDTELSTYVKGISQWVGDIKKRIEMSNKEMAADVGKFMSELTEAETTAKNLKKISEKKKAKWLKSQEYKDKQKSYIGSLDAILVKIGELTKTAGELKKLNKSDNWVDKNFAMKADMDVADFKERASMDLNNVLQNYENNKNQIDGYVRKWRDSYKAIPVQMAVLTKWAADADKMEVS